MATLDTDVQDATTVIRDLLAALAASNPVSPVSQADQDALEAAIADGQAALTPASGSDPLSFTPGASISTALGQPASFSVGTITGGTPPYTVNGLPDGLTADGGGNVSGTPTGTGTSTLTVSDSAGNSASGSVTLTVS